jgi:hypothetical protein
MDTKHQGTKKKKKKRRELSVPCRCFTSQQENNYSSFRLFKVAFASLLAVVTLHIVKAKKS